MTLRRTLRMHRRFMRHNCRVFACDNMTQRLRRWVALPDDDDGNSLPFHLDEQGNSSLSLGCFLTNICRARTSHCLSSSAKCSIERPLQSPFQLSCENTDLIAILHNTLTHSYYHLHHYTFTLVTPCNNFSCFNSLYGVLSAPETRTTSIESR